MTATSYERLVWAYKCLPELNNQLGFVACDSALAERLIASGEAQDPAIGAHHFKEMEEPKPSQKPPAEQPPPAPAQHSAKADAEYETKVMKPARRTRVSAAETLPLDSDSQGDGE